MKARLFIIPFICLILGLTSCFVNNQPKVVEQARGNIYERYFSEYVKHSLVTNANNLVISAIFREMSNAYITNNFNTVSNGLSYQREYFNGLSSNVVSYNYPIMAKEGDILITQGIMVEILGSYEGNDNAFKKEIKNVVVNVANKFIVRINNYEYEKRD